MDEGRKRVILIAASILAARQLADWDGGQEAPKHKAAIYNALSKAEKIMRHIDERWRDQPNGGYRNLDGRH